MNWQFLEPLSTRESPVARLLHQHKRWLTLLGALIMAMSFVTKEVWREGLKRKSEKIEQALKQFDEHAIAIRTQADRAKTHEELAALHALITKPGIRDPDVIGPESHAATFSWLALKSLIEVGETPKTATEYHQQGVKDHGEELLLADIAASRQSLTAGDEDKLSPANLSPAERQQRADDLQREVSLLGIDAYFEITEAKERYDHQYEIATTVLYVCFSLGFLVTVIPSVFGVEAGVKP